MRNHTKSVALYCAEQRLNIRCNSIHPAAVLTPIWEPMLGTGPDRQARMAAFVADTPLRRFGDPNEVTALAVMLASDEAAYMTGAELNIDGGAEDRLICFKPICFPERSLQGSYDAAINVLVKVRVGSTATPGSSERRGVFPWQRKAASSP